MGGVTELVGNLLFGVDKPKAPPPPKIPAAPAPEARQDTGALVVTGDQRNERVSSSKKKSGGTPASGGDILGGLGKGGLNV